MSPEMTSFSITERRSIVDEARKWIGVPFKHQGRNTNGIDCVGLLIKVGGALGYLDEDLVIRNYGRRSHYSFVFTSYFEKHLIPKDVRDLQIGDIVAVREEVFPCHCGIIGEKYGELTFIHSHSLQGKVLEEYYFKDGWDVKTVGVFEYRKK